MPEKYTTRAAVAAAIQRYGGVVAALDDGIEPDQMPDESLRDDWTRLSQARDAFDHVARALEEQLPHLNHPPTRPTEPVKADSLVPGHTIYRYTEPVARRLATWMPCCGREVRVIKDSGPIWAACCSCRLLFDLALESDIDGGAYAVFVVAHRRMVAAQHRHPVSSALSPTGTLPPAE